MKKGKNKKVNVNSIIIGSNASRKIVGDLKLLKESILREGILENPGVQKHKDSYLLIYGQRRVTAYKELLLENDKLPQEIEVVVYPQLPIDNRFLAEIMENYARAAYTAGESACVKERLHDIMIKKHGQRLGRVEGGWSTGDTAALLHESKGLVIRDLKIAAALKKLPPTIKEQFLKIKQRSALEAQLKIIHKTGKECEVRDEYESIVREAAEPEKKEPKKEDEGLSESEKTKLRKQARKKKEEKERVGITKLLAPRYQVGSYFDTPFKERLYNFADVDPPFSNEYIKKSASKGHTSAHFKDITKAEYPKFLRRTMSKLNKELTEDCWIIVWCANNPIERQLIFQHLRKMGFNQPQVAAWITPGGRTQNNRVILSHNTQSFIYAKRGKVELHIQNRGKETFECNTVHNEVRIHASEKPVSLLRDIYSTFVGSNSNILIPFLGSGNGIIAAHMNHCYGEGTELSEPYKNKFITRLMTTGYYNNI